MTNSTTIYLLRSFRCIAKHLKEKFKTGKVNVCINLDNDTIEIVCDLNKEE